MSPKSPGRWLMSVFCSCSGKRDRLARYQDASTSVWGPPEKIAVEAGADRQDLLDLLPPEITAPAGTVTADADRPGGACVDLVASGTVSATDDSLPITFGCVADATGSAVCTLPGDSPSALPLPLNAPGMPTSVTCTATAVEQQATKNILRC